jgi:hypothetical protein
MQKMFILQSFIGDEIYYVDFHPEQCFSLKYQQQNFLD